MSAAAPLLPAAAPAALPPLSLYIHLPWCGRKCPYCDFNSHNAPRQLPQADYLRALKADLTADLPAVWGRQLCAIFIGGGTPSLFAAAALEELLSAARALFNFSPHIEITLEANPDSSDSEKFAAFKQAGVNRLSLGAQSFNDDALARLGRLHDAAAAKRAASLAAQTFSNINIDLMHALPQQSARDALRDVDIACEVAPQHLSLYQLTLEPGTPFYRQPPPGMPSADAAADIGEAVKNRAQSLGYQQYEVSAYAAASSARCRHNLNYWTYGDYLGIGAGAHAKITRPAPDGSGGIIITRAQRVKHPADYMRRALAGAAGDAGAAEGAVASRCRLSRDESVFEFMLNALRLTDGFPLQLIQQRAGAQTPHMRRALEAAESQGLLTRDLTTLRPTEKGQRYLNDLTALFLPPDVPAASSAAAAPLAQ